MDTVKSFEPFSLFSFLFFSHGGKLSKGCIHPTLRFPVGVPINRREIVSTFQARDVIPIHSDVAFARVSTFVTSSDAPLIIRDLGPYVCACFEDERPRTEYWYASERFNASLMDTAIYIYIYRRRTREEFECLIERFRRAKCYINIYIYIFGNWNIFSRNYMNFQRLSILHKRMFHSYILET